MENTLCTFPCASPGTWPMMLCEPEVQPLLYLALQKQASLNYLSWVALSGLQKKLNFLQVSLLVIHWCYK
uniref:Uncharacterized protein n=1 Tax=Rhizophora mucronata TaxID=61149 RepID=A0A2P2K915_RHIMU